MLRLFTQVWSAVPVVFLDTETTGIRPGFDAAVQVGLVRFENRLPVAQHCSLVRPGIPIPEAATAIHGITDAMCADAPTIAEVFARSTVLELLDGAQPGAYNAAFDRYFVPPWGDEWAQPWLDALSLVRAIDRFVSGKGRHKLSATALRHGIELNNAHDAAADAKAAGQLFYKLAPTKFGPTAILGDVLLWQRIQEAESWHNFHSWLAKQPPREEPNNASA